MSDDRRRDGSKPSFSELDKRRRERRERRDPDRPRSPKRVRDRAGKAYRAALEKAFDEGRVEEFAATLSRAPERRPPRTERPEEPSTSTSEQQQPREDSAAAPAPPTEEQAAEARRRATARKTQAKRRELEKKIRDASNPKEVTEAVDRYLAKFDTLPRDYELLEKSLRHRSAEVVLRVLRELKNRLESEKPRRSRSLSMRLALLEETHDDDDVRDLAAEVRKAL